MKRKRNSGFLPINSDTIVRVFSVSSAPSSVRGGKSTRIRRRVFGDMAMNHIIPIATRYQSMLIDNVHKVSEVFPKEEADKINADNMALIKKISSHTSFIIENIHKMIEARKIANKVEDTREKSILYHDKVAPFLESIRYHIDKLELIVADDMWPLPKYRELLFIR